MSQINIQSLHSRIKQKIEEDEKNRQSGTTTAGGDMALQSVQRVTEKYKTKVPAVSETKPISTPAPTNQYQSPAIQNLTAPQTQTPAPVATAPKKDSFKLGGQGTQDFLATGAAGLFTGTTRLLTAPGNLAIRWGMNPANYAGARLGQAVYKTLGAITPDNGFFSKMGDDFYTEMREGYRNLQAASDEIVRTGGEIARQHEKIQMQNTSFDEYMQTRDEELSLGDLTDPRFWLFDVYKSTMENAPLMAATLGVGAKAKGVQIAYSGSSKILSFLAQNAAGIGGTTAFSLGTNAVVESESAYNAAIQNGKSEYEAAIEAERTFNRNLAGNTLLETAQMSLLFAPQLKPASAFMKYAVAAAKLGAAGIIEVGQERLESAISEQAPLENIDLKKIAGNVFSREITKGDFISFVLGVGMQGVGNAFVSNREIDKELGSQIDEVASILWQQSGKEGDAPTGAAANSFIESQIDTNQDSVVQAYNQAVQNRAQFIDSAQTGATIATDTTAPQELAVFTSPDGSFANIQIKEIDGQFVSGFVANAGDFGAQVDFDYNQPFTSREQAYQNAAKAMLDWVDQQKNSPNVSPETRNRLEEMASRVRAPQAQSMATPDQPAQGSQATPQSAPVVSVSQVAGGWGVSYRTADGQTVSLPRTFPTQAIAQSVADTLQPVTEAPQKKTAKTKAKKGADAKKTEGESQTRSTVQNEKGDELKLDTFKWTGSTWRIEYTTPRQEGVFAFNSLSKKDLLEQLADFGYNLTEAEIKAIKATKKGDDGATAAGKQAAKASEPKAKADTTTTEKDLATIAQLLHKDAFAPDGTFEDEDSTTEALTDAEQQQLEALVDQYGMTIDYGESEGALLTFKDDVTNERAKEVLTALVAEYSNITGGDYSLVELPDGKVEVYHGTAKKNADQILDGGFNEGTVYASPSPEAEAGGVGGAREYGDTILAIAIEPKSLSLNGLGEFQFEVTDSTSAEITTKMYEDDNVDNAIEEMTNALKARYPEGVTLYHQTSNDSKKAIEGLGFKGDKNNEVYFSLGGYDKNRSTDKNNEAIIEITLRPSDYAGVGIDRGTYQGDTEAAQYRDLAQAIANGNKNLDVTLLAEDADRLLKRDNTPPKKSVLPSSKKKNALPAGWKEMADGTIYVKERKPDEGAVAIHTLDEDGNPTGKFRVYGNQVIVRNNNGSIKEFDTLAAAIEFANTNEGMLRNLMAAPTKNVQGFLDETYSNQLQKTNALKQLEKDAPISIEQHGDTILEVADTYLKAKAGKSGLDARTFTDRDGDTVEVVYSERKSVSGDPEYLLTFATRNSDGVRSSVSGNIGKYGADYIQWSLKKTVPPSKKTTPAAPKTTGKVSKITVSSKSVRDNTQSATIEGDTITLTNRAGRKTVTKTEIPLEKWTELENSFGNPNSNKRRYVESLNTVPPPTELGSRNGVRAVIPMNEGEGSVFASRIIDAQISVINEAYSQWAADKNWRTGFEKKDIYEQGALLRAIADGKSTVQELSDVLDRIGTYEKNNISWAVGMNPAANEAVRKRAFEMYKDSISDDLALYIEQNNYDPREYPTRRTKDVKQTETVPQQLEKEGKPLEAAVLRDTQNVLTVVPDSLVEDVQAVLAESGAIQNQIALLEVNIPKLVQKHGKIAELAILEDGSMPFVFADGTKGDLNTVKDEMKKDDGAFNITKNRLKDLYKTAKSGAKDLKYIMVVDPETGERVQKGMERPTTLVKKNPLKDFLAGRDQVVFTVLMGEKDGKFITKEGQPYLYYKDDRNETILFPSALGLLDVNLTVGQQVVLDASELKNAGTYYRLVDSEGNVMGENIEFSERTWHGSRHKWQRPDLNYVGTGEGAAAFSWGFYVTEIESVGRDYRDRLTPKVSGVDVLSKTYIDGMSVAAGITKNIPKEEQTVKGMIAEYGRDPLWRFSKEGKEAPDWTYISDAINKTVARLETTNTWIGGQVKILEKDYGDINSQASVDAIIKDYRDLLVEIEQAYLDTVFFDSADFTNVDTIKKYIRRGWPSLDVAKDEINYNAALIKAMKEYNTGLDKKKIDTQFEAEGYLYEIEVNDQAIETMMLWDEPLSKQPQVVKDAISKLLGSDPKYKSRINSTNVLDREYAKGEWIYHYLQEKMGGKKEASMALLDMGVRGMKYKTGSTRNNQKQTPQYNYVSYDVSDLSILTRNGQSLALEPAETGGIELGEVVLNDKNAKLVEQAQKSPTLKDFLAKQGAPYYHGTRNVFTTFAAKEKGKNTGWDNTSWGYFFLDQNNKERARVFAEETRNAGDARPVIVKEAYIDLKNPLDVTLQGILTKENQAADIYEMLTGKRVSNKRALAEFDDMIDLGTVSEFYEALYTSEDGARFMQRKGYDGMISEFGREDGQTIKEYVVFEPEQIRTREELESLYSAVNREQTAPAKKPRFTSYENNVIRTSEINRALNSDGGLYTKTEKAKLFKKHVLPKLKKLRPLEDGEQVIFYEPATEIPGVTGIQYVNLELDRIWHHAITDKYQVKIVSESELTPTGAIQKDQYGERLYYPADNFMLDNQNRVREKATGKYAKRTAIRKDIESEFAEIVRRVEKAESDPSKPSRFLRRTPAQPSVMGNVRANPPAAQNSQVVEYDKLVKRQEIANFLRSHLDVVVRYGKYRKSASGIYKVGRGVIRLSNKVFRSDRSGGQLTTEIHEIGHHLDYAVHPFRKTIPKAELRPLLEEYGGGFDKVSQRERRPEAFAEFIRYYITQPDKAKSKSPEFYEYFESTLNNGFPEILDVLKIARRDFERWENQPDAAKVAAEIDFSGENRPTGLREMFTSLDAFYYHFIDDLNPLYGFDQDAYTAARNYRGWTGAANTFLQFGTIGRDYLTKGDNGQWKMNYKGKSYKAIIEPVAARNAEKDLSTYLVSKRSLELFERGIPVAQTVETHQNTIRQMEAMHPDFPQVANDLYEYSNSLIEYMVESGNISKEDAKKMRDLNKMYVPFHRVHEEMQDSGAFSSSGLNVANPIKRIKGSELAIVDPLESIVMNTYAIVQAAEANVVKNTLRIASQKGLKQSQRFEKVPVDMMKAASVNPQEIVAKAFGMDSDLGRLLAPTEMQQLVDMVPDTLIDLFRPAFSQKGDVVTVMVDGKAEYYVADKELYAAINGLDREQIGLAVRVFATPARMLRAGAILSPDFMLRNPIRDAGQAFIISQNRFIPGYDTVRGLASALKKDDLYQAWLASGGDMSTFVSQDRQDVRENKEVLTKRSARIKRYIVNPLEGLQYLSNLTEQASRIGEFRRALDKSGGDLPFATLASRNVSSDFARRGASTASMSAMSAFFNARIQGYTITAETIIKNPGKSMLKGAIGFTLPTILLYLLNRDDPEYWEIPRWQKDLFWLVKMPNGVWLRIPKPFEIGTIFATIPERFLEYVDKKDPKSIDGLFDLLITKNIPNPTPTGLVPIYENIANYSFFLGRPIVPQGVQNMPPADQYTPTTSEVAKILGGTINYSPAKVDNIIYGYFATLGRYTTQSLDGILKGTGIVHSVPEPAKDLSQQPVIKAFVVAPPRGSQSESLNRFYEERQTVTQHYNKFKTLLEDGSTDEAQRYIAEHPEIRMYTYYNGVARDLAEIRTVRNAVYESENLTPEQKKEKIDKLNELTTGIAYRALNMELE